MNTTKPAPAAASFSHMIRISRSVGYVLVLFCMAGKNKRGSNPDLAAEQAGEIEAVDKSCLNNRFFAVSLQPGLVFNRYVN